MNVIGFPAWRQAEVDRVRREVRSVPGGQAPSGAGGGVLGIVTGIFTSGEEIEALADSFSQRLTAFEQEVNANPQFQRKPGGKGMVYDDGGNKGGHDAFVNALSGIDYDWFGTVKDQPDLKEGAPGYKKGMLATIKGRWISDGNDVDVVKLFNNRLDAVKATYQGLGYKSTSVDPKPPDTDPYGAKALASAATKVAVVAAVGAVAYFGIKYLLPSSPTPSPANASHYGRMLASYR